ncbi:hypothetical protein BGZ83_003639 [Gryganskiella cystojenkinii]|nr:hypothetical protein BGZ83_003639 [Gryganskiella cystojenkinii]
MDNNILHRFTPQEKLELLYKTASSDPSSSVYESFLGIELNPSNLLFFKTIPIAFALQPFLFYVTWYLVPSLTKNRRGLSWILTTYCGIVMCSLSLLIAGHMRLTIFDHLGLDSISLGLPTTATVFSHWTPTFHKWATQLGSSTTAPLPTGYLANAINLIGQGLRWFIYQPIFSLAPLQKVSLASLDRPYFFGGGGHLLISLENYPNNAMLNSIIAGYFVGYAIGDQVMSYHYRDQVGLLTGDVHHVIYTLVTLSLSRAGCISVFALLAGISEFPTAVLGLGYMFPQLKSDFWFATTFFLSRILFNFAGLHELAFNFGPAGGSAYIYTASLIMHLFWFSKFIRIQRYKARLRAKARLEQLEKEKPSPTSFSNNDSKQSRSSSNSSKASGSVIQLRVKAEGAK